MIILRVISGAAESIADPAFMLITSMWYTRAEQPSRISTWYAANGLGVAGGGLIGYGMFVFGLSPLSSFSIIYATCD
jgi:MFS family permease